MAFDTKMSKSTTSKISSGGLSSVEESKSGVIVHSKKKATSSLAGVKHSGGGRKGHGKNARVRTLSNSEMSSHSAENRKEESNEAEAAEISDDDSWTVSHDMLMIDEVHTSEESENLSAHRHHYDAEVQHETFFNLGLHVEEQ